MSVASRPVSTGKTRTCPHCKATILESLSICPGCMHHLRFDSEAAKRQVAAAPALRVEGIIRQPPLDQPQEYFVIIAIRNDRGEEVTRQVVGVGALQPSEKRTFSLSVEVLPPQAPPAAKTVPAGKQGTTAPPAAGTAASAPGAATPAAAATVAGGGSAAAAGRSGSTGTFPAVSDPQTPAAKGTGQSGPAGTAQPARSPVSAPPGPTPAVAPPAASSAAATPKATYPGGLKPPTPGAPRPPMPGGFKKH